MLHGLDHIYTHPGSTCAGTTPSCARWRNSRPPNGVDPNVTSPALSVLDLVPVRSDQTTADALGGPGPGAHGRRARLRSYWLAEHHNMPAVAATIPPVTDRAGRRGDLADPGRAPAA